MESKNNNSKAPRLQLGGSKPSSEDKSGSTTFSGRVTRSMAKAGEANIPTTFLPKPLPVFGSVPSKVLDPQGDKQDKVGATIDEIATSIEKALSQLSTSNNFVANWKARQRNQKNEEDYANSDCESSHNEA